MVRLECTRVCAFSLTCGSIAVCLRIPDIEQSDRKRAKLALTRDPVQVLHFLGMAVADAWEKPFDTVDALFDYAATCRFLPLRDPGDAEEQQPRTVAAKNDRRRVHKRPVFRRWLLEFVPRLRQRGCFPPRMAVTDESARDMTRIEAFARFPGVYAEYNARLKAWRLQKNMDEVFRIAIKGTIPQDGDPSYRGVLVSAMKMIILHHDTSYGLSPRKALFDSDGFYDLDATRSFVADNLGKLGPIAWARHQERRKERTQGAQAQIETTEGEKHQRRHTNNHSQLV
jgi:hypothetical protein